MFQILDTSKTIRFMRWARPATWLSLALVLLSVASLGINKINWGLDFTGGTLIEIGFTEPAELEGIRDVLTANEFGDAVVQHFGSTRDVMVRLSPRENVKGEELGDEILQLVKSNINADAQLRRLEFVGPSVGAELAEEGGLAILAALLCILVYVGFRFEWRLAVGSVAALAHDVMITLGIFSFLQIEFDLTILAALLTVVGYSLNDTIVVFDRIRENFRRMRKGDSVDIIDESLTQTLSRTLITSGTTMMVLIALFMKGGVLIHGFATALLIGILVGTYSSIYVASNLALKLGISRETMIPPEVEKEGADLDSMP